MIWRALQRQLPFLCADPLPSALVWGHEPRHAPDLH
ncbi:hypothetical protein RR11_1209 [Ruegeria sp. R11]|nr:hypothetical protein RR11_1209 [Ruegeria sp. R11]